jgi:pilus assembly protein CpaC
VTEPHRRRRAPALLAALLLQPALFVLPAASFELVEPQSEQTVDLVVGTGQLIRVEEEFASLFVANPEVADIEVKSPRLLYLTGVGVGETTLFAVDDADNVLMSSKIRVTHNLGALQDGIRRVAPGQKVTATTVDQSLVITGSVGTADEATNILQVASQFVDDPTRVVNRMTVAAPIQVNLQVRIAEVARNVDRQLGIRWSASSNFGNGGRVGVIGGGGVTGDGAYSIGVGLTRGSFSIDVLLQALAEEGLVTIMAEPNLTARSGEPARFLAGGEYPYAVTNDDENTIEFKDFGIGLSFTPTVMDSNRISLKVATEVSELDFARDPTMPSLNTRRAETTVDLASGQSFAIAGLMQNSASQAASKMPGMGTLPVLGALFRSTSFRRGQTELVIIVTPIIVSPTSGKRLSTPVDQYVPPNDFERILLGRFQGSAKQTQVQNRLGNRRLHGQSGFVFE